jgi:antitoxin MazE
LRIPKPVLLNSGLSSDDCVEIVSYEDGFLVKKCQAPKKYDLKQLVDGISDENRHDVLSWDDPRGKEIW